MAAEVQEAWERRRKLRFPRLGGRANLLLYDSLLAGVATTYLQHGTIKDGWVPVPSEETWAYVDAIRGKEHHTDEEMLLLEYFDAMEEVRVALERTARGDP
jgi:hypothetical protein